MAIYEGLCPNCGSLMRLNDENETVHCIFCWADVNVEKAIELGKNHSGYEFPNETFPEPDPETQAAAFKAQGLGAANIVSTPSVQAPARRKTEEGRLTPREKVALQNKPIVKPYCSKKHRLMIVGGVAGFFVLLVLIALPIYFLRENKKTELKSKLVTIAAYTEDDSRYSIQHQNNNLITIVSPDKVTEEDAKQVFDGYANAYAEVYGISKEDASAKVEVNLIDSETGGFGVKEVTGEVQATALK